MGYSPNAFRRPVEDAARGQLRLAELHLRLRVELVDEVAERVHAVVVLLDRGLALLPAPHHVPDVALELVGRAAGLLRLHERGVELVEGVPEQEQPWPPVP